MRIICVGILVISGLLGSAHGEDPPPSEIKNLNQKVDNLSTMVQELRLLLEQQKRRIDALEEENLTLQNRDAGQRPSPPPAPAPVPPPPAVRRSIQSLNPDIGGVVDMVAISSETNVDEEGIDRFSVREIELTIGHDIDTYARFDATITFSDFEDVGIEEAFVTYWDLPWDLQLRVGRMRQIIGKATALHVDQLDTVDEPLVVQRYFGVEGLFRTGVEISRFLPQPIDSWTHQLTLGIMEGGGGEGGNLFGDTRRRLSYYAHLKNFWEISPSTNLELGFTYLQGSKDGDHKNEVLVFGFDATLFHYFSSTRRLKWQSELYTQHRDDSFSFSSDGFRITFDKRPTGFYSLVDFQATKRWAFGVRYDYVELIELPPFSPRKMDRAYTAYVTFFQSEFARLRLQYQHATFADGDEDDIVALQSTYSFGVHKHRIQ